MKMYWITALLFFLFHCSGSRTVNDIRVNPEISLPKIEIQAIQKVNVEVQYVRKKWFINLIIPIYSETLLNAEKGHIDLSESTNVMNDPLLRSSQDTAPYMIIHRLIYGFKDYFVADGKSRGAKAYLLSKAISSVPETNVLIDPSFSEQCNNVQGWPLIVYFLVAVNESSCTLRLRAFAGKTVFKG